MTALVSRRQVLHGLAASLLLPPAFAAGELPGDSVYRLDAALSDQDGKAFALADLRGTPVLASMFYTSCDMVCPMTSRPCTRRCARCRPRNAPTCAC